MMMKTTLPKPPMDKTRTTTTICPNCKSDNFIKDYPHEEIYCKDCGLVLSEPSLNTNNIIPHSPPFDARNGIHTRYIRHTSKGSAVRSSKVTRYRHNLSDKELMKKGR